MKEKILYKDLSYKLVGCFYDVYNELGPGFKEVIYHKALGFELDSKNIPYEEEKRLSIRYKGKIAGVYVPDFVIDNKILVEIKAVENTPKIYELQLYYYLKGTNYELGYLVNFGSDKISIKRRIYNK